MNKLLLVAILLCGCANVRTPVVTYTTAPEVSCVSVSVQHYTTAIFTGEDGKTGVGSTCDEAYQNYKQLDTGK